MLCLFRVSSQSVSEKLEKLSADTEITKFLQTQRRKYSLIKSENVDFFDFIQSHKTISVRTSLVAYEELLVIRVEKCSVQPCFVSFGQVFEKKTRVYL